MDGHAVPKLLLETAPPPHIQLLLRVVVPPSFSGHQSALFCWRKKDRFPWRVRARLLLCLPRMAQNVQQMTARDEGRTNMRPTNTVCSIAPSRHCSAR